MTSEREGATGVRSVVGRQAGVDIVLVQVPPYPEAVAEVVSELYLFGVRRIISISRAYSIGRRMSQRPVVIAKAAIPLDSVSREISGEELPLMPSSKMEYTFRSIAELRFSDFNWVYGYTITVPTIYVRPLIEKIRKIAGKRGVVAVDTVTAALYALQYEYTHLETLSLLVLAGHLDQYASSSIARSLDEHSSIIEYIGRNETILYMVAIEILKRLREA